MTKIDHLNTSKREMNISLEKFPILFYVAISRKSALTNLLPYPLLSNNVYVTNTT